MSDEEFDDLDELTKEYTYYTEALNKILVAAECPDEIRAFIDYLIGASHGRSNFEIGDRDLQKSRPVEGLGTEMAGMKWVQRHRDKLEDWQHKSKLLFIEFTRGSKKVIYEKSKYHLHILRYVESVITEAKSSKLWPAHPSAAIEEAAQTIVQQLKSEERDIPIKIKYKRQGLESISGKLKSARSHLERVRQILDDNDMGLIQDDEELFNEVKQILEKLGDKKGYWGDWSRGLPDE